MKRSSSFYTNWCRSSVLHCTTSQVFSLDIHMYHLHMCTYCLTIDIIFYIKISNTMIIIADFDEVRVDYSLRKVFDTYFVLLAIVHMWG